MNLRVRYFLRVTVSRSYASNTVQEQEFLVHLLQPDPDVNNSIKMEVCVAWRICVLGFIILFD
jgi:vacuolar protein sorting-associated protein 26